MTNKQAVQGASTIPQQFVKLPLAAENKRTVFEKLREAALAYHLTRKWSKERILRNYLNAIYFGNGAYGIESAARTYFSYNHSDCGGRGQPHVRVGAAAPGGGAAGRDGRLAQRATTRSQHPVAATQPPRPRAAADVRAGLPHARAVRERARDGAAHGAAT